MTQCTGKKKNGTYKIVKLGLGNEMASATRLVLLRVALSIFFFHLFSFPDLGLTVI